MKDRQTDAEPWWLMDSDYVADVFPWTWTDLSDFGMGAGMGSISSPNGRRPDGRMHTYWTISSEVWQPHGELICEAVNLYVQKGWRARIGRWLLRSTLSAGVTKLEADRTADKGN